MLDIVMDGDNLYVFHRPHIRDPRLYDAQRKHFEVVDDLGIRYNSIGVVSVDEGVVEIVDALRVEFILLYQLSLLVDTVASLYH